MNILSFSILAKVLLYHLDLAYGTCSIYIHTTKIYQAITIYQVQEDPLERNNNALQYSCLGIPMDRGAW